MHQRDTSTECRRKGLDSLLNNDRESSNTNGFPRGDKMPSQHTNLE